MKRGAQGGSFGTKVAASLRGCRGCDGWFLMVLMTWVDDSHEGWRHEGEEVSVVAEVMECCVGENGVEMVDRCNSWWWWGHAEGVEFSMMVVMGFMW